MAKVWFDWENSLALKEVKGKVYAVRFATGMTAEQMKESVKSSNRYDWKPFNQSTGTFC